MVFSYKQTQALAAAAPSARQAMRKLFIGQNSTSNGAARPRRDRWMNTTALQNAPRSSNLPRGQKADMSEGHWAQTPATSNVVAPRGFGYYDAFEHDPFSVGTHMSIGPATPVVGTTIVSEGLVTNAPGYLAGPGPAAGLEGGAILLIVMPSTSGTQARAFRCTPNIVGDFTTTDLVSSTNYNSPQLLSDAPNNAIPTRCSLRIRNWTQHIGVGGIVRILRMTTGVALNSLETTNGELATFMEGIRSHTRTRTYGGEELLESHQKNCTVVDQSKATWFSDWNAITPNNLLPWTLAEGWDQVTGVSTTFTQQLHDPSYTPIAILFEPFVAAVAGGVVGNKYEVNVRSQFLTHYTQGSMLANMAISPPTVPDALTKHRDAEEGKGSILERLGSALRDGASWAWNQKSDIIPAGYAAWKFVSPSLKGASKLALV